MHASLHPPCCTQWAQVGRAPAPVPVQPSPIYVWYSHSTIPKGSGAGTLYRASDRTATQASDISVPSAHSVYSSVLCRIAVGSHAY